MKKMQNRIVLTLVLTLCIACALPGLYASAESAGTFTKGVDDIYYEFYSANGLPITGVAFLSGSLPPGVAMYWDQDRAYITGVPQEEGFYITLFAVATSEAVAQVELSMNVSATAPAPAQQTVVPGAQIQITKSPTGEYVEVGGTAKFVARANNAERLVWRIVSNDTTNTVQASEAADYFPGLQVSGLGQETLILSNIPRSLDGWRIEAQFWNGNRHAESNGALVTIVDENGRPIGAVPTAAPTASTEPFFALNTPSVGSQDLPVNNEARTANIVYQPQSAELLPGEGHTLTVMATSPNNGTLSYQWYSAATDNRSAALPIGGASEATYTVNQTEGTAYYWVAVWNTKDGSRSQAVYSDAAEVTIVTPGTPTPVPTPMPTPVPTPAQRIGGASNISFQLILFGAIGVLALIALIGVVIYLRADAKQKAAEEEEERRNQN